MTRRQYVENIIIGTLLESTEKRNYFDDCRCCITEDMLEDELNRRIFSIVAEMNAQGNVRTDPYSIFEKYGEVVLDILSDMMDLVVDFSFIHLKMDYNERQFLSGLVNGTEAKRTDVEFVDYVKQFITLVFSKDEERRKRHNDSEDAAA